MLSIIYCVSVLCWGYREDVIFVVGILWGKGEGLLFWGRIVRCGLGRGCYINWGFRVIRNKRFWLGVKNSFFFFIELYF